MTDTNSLSHSKWNCKYHIVFAPKYRRKVFYKEKRLAVGKILRNLYKWKRLKELFWFIEVLFFDNFTNRNEDIEVKFMETIPKKIKFIIGGIPQ